MRGNSFLIFLIVFNFTYGQTHLVGISPGFSISTVERPNFPYYGNVLGAVCDGYYEFNKSHFVSKSTIGFQHKGFSQEIIYIDTSGNILGEGAIENQRFSYISVSNIAGVLFGDNEICPVNSKKWKIFMIAGGGLALNYYFRTLATSNEFTLNNGSKTSGYRYIFANQTPIDLSLKVETQFGIHFKNGNAICVILNYNHGLNKIRYSNVVTPEPWLNRTLNFMFTVKKTILN